MDHSAVVPGLPDRHQAQQSRRDRTVLFLLGAAAVLFAVSCSGNNYTPSNSADSLGSVLETLEPTISRTLAEDDPLESFGRRIIDDEATLLAVGRFSPEVDFDTEFLHLAVTGECGVPPDGPWLEIRERGPVLRTLDWSADFECARAEMIFHVFVVDRSHRDRYDETWAVGLPPSQGADLVLGEADLKPELFEDLKGVSPLTGNEVLQLVRWLREPHLGYEFFDRSTVVAVSGHGCVPLADDFQLSTGGGLMLQRPAEERLCEVTEDYLLIYYEGLDESGRRIRVSEDSGWEGLEHEVSGSSQVGVIEVTTDADLEWFGELKPFRIMESDTAVPEAFPWLVDQEWLTFDEEEMFVVVVPTWDCGQGESTLAATELDWWVVPSADSDMICRTPDGEPKGQATPSVRAYGVEPYRLEFFEDFPVGP